MIYSFNYCSFLKERSTHFNADSTVTTVKIAEIISGIKKKKKKKACGLMRHKNAGTVFLTTDQEECPEDSTLLLEILLLIYVVFVLYVKKGSLVW